MAECLRAREATEAEAAAGAMRGEAEAEAMASRRAARAEAQAVLAEAACAQASRDAQAAAIKQCARLEQELAAAAARAQLQQAEVAEGAAEAKRWQAEAIRFESEAMRAVSAQQLAGVGLDEAEAAHGRAQQQYPEREYVLETELASLRARVATAEDARLGAKAEQTAGQILQRHLKTCEVDRVPPQTRDGLRCAFRDEAQWILRTAPRSPGPDTFQALVSAKLDGNAPPREDAPVTPFRSDTVDLQTIAAQLESVAALDRKLSLLEKEEVPPVPDLPSPPPPPPEPVRMPPNWKERYSLAQNWQQEEDSGTGWRASPRAKGSRRTQRGPQRYAGV